MQSPERMPAVEKSHLPELDASLALVKGVAAARGRHEEREYVDNLVGIEAARAAQGEEEAARQSRDNAAAEIGRQEVQNEGLKEVQAEADAIEAKIVAMKKERANWDWNNIPALVSALGKMVKGGDAGLVGELEAATKALGLMNDLESVKKQIEFVQSAQPAPKTETRH